MDVRCRIELFGGLRVQQGERVITRFRAHKYGAMLAYLAYFLHQRHPRDVLIELFWPEGDLDAQRNRLSAALSSLRHQLEPPGTPAGAVILADRNSVRLNPAAVTTDVGEFEAAIGLAERARGAAEREQELLRAVELYRGPLLPGYYEEWIPAEQERLAERYLQALRQLGALAEQGGDLTRALDYARRAAGADPLREELHQELMRRYAAIGQPSAALSQYRELERILQEELGEAPSSASRQLAQEIERHPSRSLPAAAPTLPLPRPAAPNPTLNTQHPTPLPAGTVTFLLTDIERPAALYERSADAFPPAPVEYHALLREQFRRHGGHEVQQAGGSFLVAFERAGDALACAVAAQRALWNCGLRIADCGSGDGEPPLPSGAASPSFAPPHSSDNPQSAIRNPQSSRVRMALHTGDVELVEGEYRGLALQHLSRIAAAAHGGQILCSEATAAVLRRGGIAAVEPGVRLADLGVYRLREVGTPERLFQAEYPEMAATEFPPPKAEAGHLGNLPLQFTRFFGRQQELVTLRNWLLSEPQDGLEGGAPGLRRLVTLTGPGGSGKTRLALEAAAQLVEALRGAVWFVLLADLTDAARVPDAIRDALRLPPAPHINSLDQVVEALARQPSLLVLDNFEQLVEGGAPLVKTLLARVPSLVCMVTSRQRLDLEGEGEFPVMPLPVPGVQVFRSSGVQEGQVQGSRFNVQGSEFGEQFSTPNTQHPTPKALPEHRKGTARRAPTGTPERLILYESVQLFVDRAQAVRPDFQLNAANADSVAELCRRLEGIPLAIELAAARSQVLTPAQMLAQLERRFDFLVSRRRDAVARHRTLRAAIDWGYQLLVPELQRFFARLSVFRGGWTLEAAEAVCATGAGVRGWGLGVGTDERSATLDEGRETRDAPRAPTPNPQPPTPDVLDYLAQLQECSLVLAEEGAGGMRFRMLETLREYAGEQLAPEEREELHRRHAEYFLALAETAGPELWRAEQARWMDRLELEHPNLRAALEWSLREGDPEVALRLAGAIWRFWHVRGYGEEGREWLVAALSRPETSGPSAMRAKALDGVGVLFLRNDDARARRFYEEMLSIARALDDKSLTATALNGLGDVAWAQHDYPTARRLLEESLTLSREAGDQWCEAFSLFVLALIRRGEGDYDGAWPFFHQSLALRRALGDKRSIAFSLSSMANLANRQRDWKEASLFCEEALSLGRELSDKRLILSSLQLLGWFMLQQGNLARARALCEECLCYGVEDQKPLEAWSLRILGEIALRGGDYEAARSVFEQALSIFQALGNEESASWTLRCLGFITWRQGRYETARQIYEEGLALCQQRHASAVFAGWFGGRGAMELCRGDLLRAAETFKQGLSKPHSDNPEGVMGVAICLGGLASLAAVTGQPERAVRLLHAADELWQSVSNRWTTLHSVEYERCTTRAREHLDESSGQGKVYPALPVEQAISDARALEIPSANGQQDARSAGSLPEA